MLFEILSSPYKTGREYFYYGENLFNLEKRKNSKKWKGFKFVIVFEIVVFIYHLSYNKNIKGVCYDDERD